MAAGRGLQTVEIENQIPALNCWLLAVCRENNDLTNNGTECRYHVSRFVHT